MTPERRAQIISQGFTTSYAEAVEVGAGYGTFVPIKTNKETVMRNYPKVCQWVFNEPWAMLQDKLEAIIGVVGARVMGGPQMDAESEAAYIAAREPKLRRVRGGVAVLPLEGVIAQKMDLMTAMSGGTSTDRFAAQFDQAIADPSVGAIVIDVDSPGGSVYGVSELSDKIFEARGKKKIYAVSNSLMASAAYWIASAADKLYVTPGGEAGSIGVIAVHTDVSKAEEGIGVKTSLITAGKYKGEGNPYEPLGDEARASLQKRVNEYYGMFTAAVARNRGASPGAVRSGYGQGRVLGAKEAVSEGLADGIKTLQGVIDDLTGAASAAGVGAAVATWAA